MNRIIMMALIILTSISVSAQKNIEKLIKEIEGMKDVTTTYSERRTPKSHKLYRISLVMNISRCKANEKIFERIPKAFEADRKDAVSATKTNSSFHYEFVDDKGRSTYTFNGLQLVKKWESNESEYGQDLSDAFDSDFKELSKASIKTKRRLQREKARLQRQLAKKDRELKKLETTLSHDLARR